MSGRLFVLELGTEELPHHFIDPALEHLALQIGARLDAERLPHGAITTAGTPRRLIVRIAGLAATQPDFTVEHFGPPVSVAFKDGAPTRAAEAFATRLGVPLAQLGRRVQAQKNKEVECLFFAEKRTGRATAELLAEVLPAVIAAIPTRKSMRWGEGRTTFCRPLRWILALHGTDIVTLAYTGVTSGRATWGHRFHVPGRIEVPEAEAHAALIEKAMVMADAQARRDLIAQQAERLAASAGGRVVHDEALLHEVAHLVEWPFPMLGTFDRKFLDLPKELLITVMRVHQRYFPIVDAAGSLTHHFVIVSGTKVHDPKVVAAGNAKVIAARFWDARFLFQEDRQKTLEQHGEGLRQVMFIQQLGTMAERVERIRRLSAWLCDALAVAAPARAETDRVASLCKADLSSRMVFEFPELAGVMGRDYALAQGESPAVATAIAEHYLPKGADEALPQSVPAAIVALADRMDSLCGIFGIGETVTGAKDKYGLRRAMLGVLRIIKAGAGGTGLPVPLTAFVRQGIREVAGRITKPAAELESHVIEFARERLRSWLSETWPGDVANAVLAVGIDDIGAVFRRAQALGRMVASDAAADAGTLTPFRALVQASKRSSNILKQAIDKGYLQAAEIASPGAVEATLLEPPEKELVQAVAGMEAAGATATLDDTLGRLAEMKGALDRFFGEDSKSGVMVMVPDNERLRTNRLRILARLRRLVWRVADLSLISR